MKQKQRKLGIDPETDKQYSGNNLYMMLKRLRQSARTCTHARTPPLSRPELTMKDYESEYAAHVSHPYERVQLFPVELTTFLTL